MNVGVNERRVLQRWQQSVVALFGANAENGEVNDASRRPLTGNKQCIEGSSSNASVESSIKRVRDCEQLHAARLADQGKLDVNFAEPNAKLLRLPGSYYFAASLEKKEMFCIDVSSYFIHEDPRIGEDE